MTQPVSWGVLGAAKIARERVIPAMQRSAITRIDAIAARDRGRAQEAAAALGIARVYGSYEELLADPALEAIYNPLPNHLHVPWTIRALEAGKHVLCEKPIALTAREAEQLIDAEARTGRRVAEAFMVRHHPQWQRAREIVRAGTIGETRAIHVFVSYNVTDPTNLRNQADIGGGGLYDIGSYAVTVARYLFETKPVRVIALIDRDPVLRTDRLTSAILEFPHARQLVFTCSTQLLRFQRVQIVATTGRIEIPAPFNPDPTQASMIMVDTGSGPHTEQFAPCDQYMLQGDAFSRAIRGEAKLEHPIADAIMNMTVLDALFRSSNSGSWERPA